MLNQEGIGARVAPGSLERLEERMLFSASPVDGMEMGGHGPTCGCCGCGGLGGAATVHHMGDGHGHSHDEVIRTANGFEVFMDEAVPEDVLSAYLASVGADGSTSAGGETLFGLDEVPVLSSLPSSNMTIYLDFNGHTTSGTEWNSSFNGGSAFTTPAYSVDDDVTTFSELELDRIRDIWARVAEDFSPFDVNVTTAPPALDDLRLSGAGDQAWGVRVVIGGDSHDWYRNTGQSAAGGVAIVGSFNWRTDTPTYVFEDNLGNGVEKFVAEAVSHEIGHTLGLRHHGQVGNEYYGGHGNWAPIMGNSYYESVTQWSAGEFANANRSTQYDVDLIGSGREGVFFRADDHGNDFNSATHLGTGVIDVSGVISNRDDVDVFGFVTDAGVLNFTVDALGEEANLDVGAWLFDVSGEVLGVWNDPSSMDAEIEIEVAGGQLYLVVDGVGTGDGREGYTDYGSIGSYRISAEVTTPASLFGDLSGDLMVDAMDVDLLSEVIREGLEVEGSDLNGDGATDQKDLEFMVTQLMGSLVGDANLDGWVNILDLSILGDRFGESVGGWSEGDFNSDGVVDLEDLSSLALFYNKTAESHGLGAAMAAAMSDPVWSGMNGPVIASAMETPAQEAGVVVQTQVVQEQVADQRVQAVSAWATQRAELAADVQRLSLSADWLEADEDVEEVFGLWGLAA
ncbi:hypothetical protein [Mucisphaera sp.]|uniref:hypothetical protein n=1 Tax=Mucisphaera sp. TaxID=2913024 RepID=UPI003D105546